MKTIFKRILISLIFSGACRASDVTNTSETGNVVHYKAKSKTFEIMNPQGQKIVLYSPYLPRFNLMNGPRLRPFKGETLYYDEDKGLEITFTTSMGHTSAGWYGVSVIAHLLDDYDRRKCGHLDQGEMTATKQGGSYPLICKGNYLQDSLFLHFEKMQFEKFGLVKFKDLLKDKYVLKCLDLLKAIEISSVLKNIKRVYVVVGEKDNASEDVKLKNEIFQELLIYSGFEQGKESRLMSRMITIRPFLKLLSPLVQKPNSDSTIKIEWKKMIEPTKEDEVHIGKKENAEDGETPNSERYFAFYVRNLDDGDVKGGLFGKINDTDADINLLCVDPAIGGGMGTKLMQFAHEFIKKGGFNYVRLNTSSWQAPEFYEKKFGYTKNTIFKDYVKTLDGKLNSLYICEKKL